MTLLSTNALKEVITLKNLLTHTLVNLDLQTQT